MADDDEIDDDELMPHTIAGQLATIGEAKRSQFDEMITLTIDGRQVTVRRIQHVRDANHELVKKSNGEHAWRYTTVFDAASEAYSTQDMDVTQAGFDLSEFESQALYEKVLAENPIPILCHQPHMTPVTTCRVCLVEVEAKDGKEKSLVPACHRIVDEGVKVSTIRTSEKVQKAVAMILELLASDQPNPKDPKTNEFHQLYNRVQSICKSAEKPVVVPSTPRFPNQKQNRPKDFSSPVVAVDHSACILCDRCVRACGEVKKNEIIGRSGKGYATNIAFDLGELMGKSNCVECRECALSCPTDALTLPRLEVGAEYSKVHPDLRDSQAVTLEEVLANPLFTGISPKYLDWVLPLIRQRNYKKGEVVCQEGDYGHYAYQIRGGKFAITTTPREVGSANHRPHNQPGMSPRWKKGIYKRRSLDANGTLRPDHGEELLREVDHRGTLLGEMACINKQPRAASIVAMSDDCQMLLIPANVVHVMRRDPETRAAVENDYRTRAIQIYLRKAPLFQGLREDAERFEDCMDWLRNDRVQFLQVAPGQEIFRQGSPADAMYLVGMGFVRISQKGKGGGEIEANFIGPEGAFGEMAILASDREVAIECGLGPTNSDDDKGPRRTATAVAMDRVEILRIDRMDLLTLYHEYPEIAHRLQDRVKDIRQYNRTQIEDQDIVPEIVELGMMGGQKLLVMDLESCTRCDECTKACADTHQGQNRLVRDGLRIDKYLVATACRNCQDPYCMKSCPVDAIHRTISLEVVIENHCIGCGDCAKNCPYGNITMQRSLTPPRRHVDAVTGREMAVVQNQAKTCDLCADTPAQDPSCVYACPHDAAFRMSGEELMRKVLDYRQRENPKRR